MFSIMLFIFFCFFGILAMFFYIYWRQEILIKGIHEENTQTRVLIRSLESRLDYLAQLCLTDKNNAASADDKISMIVNDSPTTDPLLHLSFDDPSKNGQDKSSFEMNINL